MDWITGELFMTKLRTIRYAAGLLITVLAVVSALHIVKAEDKDAITWNYQEKTSTLVISGTGSTQNYPYEGYVEEGNPSEVVHNTPWKDYKDKAKRINIEEGITGIGEYNFDDFSILEEVTLPNSMEKISKSAFPDRASIIINGKNCSPAESFAFEGNYHFAPTNKCLRGDMNGNQIYETEDALSILNMVVRLIPFYGYSGDVNEDGKVTAIDALEVLRTVVKIK